MLSKTRTQYSIYNIKAAIIGQLAGIFISFVSRIFFLKYLNEEYLGLNGLFSNIVTVLSVVELGIGPAISFSLYKPLSDKNENKIKSIMFLYKKAYNFIGILILVLGICFMPFYRILFLQNPTIDNLNIIYWLFIINAVISYFFAYKRSLIICDQKRYVASILRYSCFFLLNILQIIVMIFSRNYILYLILQIIFTLLENIFITLYANKNYPFLLEKNIEVLSKNELQSIKKNIIAMVYHKIGGVIVGGTDNIVISKILGLSAVGIYNNFYMVIYAVQLVLQQFFNSIVASVGNLNVSEGKKKMKEIFVKTFFVNFLLYSCFAVFLLCLLNPFISVWVGEEYTVSLSIVISLIVNFYTSGMRKTAEMYREATGIFWYDRYKSLLAAFINIVASVFLAYRYGMAGVFWGTVISTILSCFWIEPLIVYKYIFKEPVTEYFKKYFLYLIDTFLRCAITYHLTSKLNTVNLIHIFFKALLCAVFNFGWIMIIWRNDKHLYFIKMYLKNKFKHER